MPQLRSSRDLVCNKLVPFLPRPYASLKKPVGFLRENLASAFPISTPFCPCISLAACTLDLPVHPASLLLSARRTPVCRLFIFLPPRPHVNLHLLRFTAWPNTYKKCCPSSYTAGYTGPSSLLLDPLELMKAACTMLFSLPLILSLSPMTLLPCTLPKQCMFRKAVLTGYCSWGFVVDPNKTRDRPPYTYT